MPANISKTVFSCAAFVALCTFVSADTIFEIFWGTHVGQNSPIDGGDDTEPSTLNYLLQLTSDGSGTQNLDATSGASAYSGDLIQLGFFDTDSSYGGTSSSISPNTSTSNYFSGTWTPLTSKTTIGQDWSSSETVGAGLFYFSSKYSQLTTPSADNDGTAISNISADSSYRITTDQLNKANVPFPATDSTDAATNDLADRVIALNGASDATASTNPLIGIRFYDTNTVGSGITRYNTIMNPNWRWSAGGTLDMSLHASNGTSNTDLVFEYDNTDAYTLNLSKVGTGNNQVANNDFVSTITYYDGSSGLDASDGGHVFSGLSGSGNITLGDDGTDVYTLHVNGANNSSTFSGNLNDSSGANANAKIIKTGSGEQIITGKLDISGPASTSFPGLVIQDGKMTFAGTSFASRVGDITSGIGGTPVLELNNTGRGSDHLISIGLVGTSLADYNGSVVLNGSGSETKIRVKSASASPTSDDYNSTQVFSGVVSSTASNKLVKEGVGELELSGNNTFTGGVEIDDGTLIAGHANALGNSNTVTITKGKLEVDNGVTLAPTTITAGDSNKTMIGGRGTLNKAVTIGSGNGQVDVISPGDGISSSLSSSSSKQQLSFGDRDNAIGTFTVSDTLTLENGGVYDWEITDFTGTAGTTGWDLLKFDTLTFDSTNDVFTINIMSLDANGSAGAMGGGDIWQSYATSSGFKFMEATGNGSGWSGSQGVISAFNVVDDGWSYYNQHWAHDWNVWYDGSGSFYLQYSVAPEPSTYVMVTGLMLVPGMNAVRKYRNRKKKQGVEEPEEEIVS